MLKKIVAKEEAKAKAKVSPLKDTSFRITKAEFNKSLFAEFLDRDEDEQISEVDKYLIYRLPPRKEYDGETKLNKNISIPH